MTHTHMRWHMAAQVVGSCSICQHWRRWNVIFTLV